MNPTDLVAFQNLSLLKFNTSSKLFNFVIINNNLNKIINFIYFLGES